jgi:hypothetical protein
MAGLARFFNTLAAVFLCVSADAAFLFFMV